MPKPFRKPKAGHQQSKRKKRMPTAGSGASGGAMGGLRGGFKGLVGRGKKSGPWARVFDIALWVAVLALGAWVMSQRCGR